MKIYRQYVDDSSASKELQACVRVIDSIVELERVRGIGIPQALRQSLAWCNERLSLIMSEMDSFGGAK
jgi:hypothetical protein